MKKVQAEKLLRRVRLELARDHEFPNDSRERGYDFIARSTPKVTSCRVPGRS